MNLKLNFFSILLVILFVVYFFGCEELAEPKQQKYPLIQTNKVSSIDSTGVVFNGEILRQGTDEVLYFGFVWATSSKPTIDDFKIVLGNEAQSSFSIKVSFDLISGKNYVVRFFAVTANNIIYGNDETFTSSGSSRPTITSFVPKNGIDADTVLIIGENFGSNPSANIVKVGTFSASILSATNKSIKFLIPKIPQGGSYKIEVTTSAKSVRSSDSFVIENPIVSSFTPTKGSDGTVITISGDFFSLNKDYNKVYLGNTLCQIIESSRNQLKIYSPYTQVVGNVKVVANVNGKATSSVADYFIEGPYITDINPLEGSYKNVGLMDIY